MSYKGRKIDIIRSQDELSIYFDCVIDGVPAIIYAQSESQAVAIAKLVIDAE
jgi:hypothetical protein